eukprot:3378986-Amphidinium_carterae.1
MSVILPFSFGFYFPGLFVLHAFMPSGAAPVFLCFDLYKSEMRTEKRILSHQQPPKPGAGSLPVARMQ